MKYGWGWGGSRMGVGSSPRPAKGWLTEGVSPGRGTAGRQVWRIWTAIRFGGWHSMGKCHICEDTQFYKLRSGEIEVFTGLGNPAGEARLGGRGWTLRCTGDPRPTLGQSWDRGALWGRGRRAQRRPLKNKACREGVEGGSVRGAQGWGRFEF